jgi:hypothetical protein
MLMIEIEVNMTKKQRIIDLVDHFYNNGWPVSVDATEEQLIRKEFPNLTLYEAHGTMLVKKGKGQFTDQQLLLYYKDLAEALQKENNRVYIAIANLARVAGI